MIQLKYRPDIDGLRAIAVLSVVIYHAFPWMIPGGFTGVDIFFVISGYLISGILYKGLKANGGAGNFSFGEFYARRVRRLFPALITVLLATMAYGWLILLPDEFQQMGKHVAAGTLFIQNIVFWQESGYFDTAASLKPLLHLWSLAVEEQFYIFFPPILLLIWKKKWPLAAIMGVLLVVSMIGNLVMSGHGGTAAFFLTPYRAWEFLGGSLLAWWHYERGHEEDVPPYREALSWGGALLLALGMAFIRTGDPYPGWRALLPVAGTLLLMEGGAGTGVKGAWVNRKILSNPAVVWIGLISYPLYLFHWPALSFVHIIKGENPKPVYCADALIISFALSVLTYYVIEKKLRHNKSKWVLPALVVSFVAVGIMGILGWKGVTPKHTVSKEAAMVDIAIKDRTMTSGPGWSFPYDNGILIKKTGGNQLQTVFFGDSNMQQYGPRINEQLKTNTESGRGALFLVGGGVPPLPNVTSPDHGDPINKTADFLELLNRDSRIDRVVIAARWTFYFDKGANYSINGIPLSGKKGHDEAIKHFDKLLAEVQKKEKEVSVVLSVPSGDALDPKRRCTRSFLGGYKISKKKLSRAEFLNENGALLGDIAAIAKKNGAQVIDPMDYLCTNGVCIAEDENGIPIRFDDGHLRPGYVREHVKYLDETVAP